MLSPTRYRAHTVCTLALAPALSVLPNMPASQCSRILVSPCNARKPPRTTPPFPGGDEVRPNVEPRPPAPRKRSLATPPALLGQSPDPEPKSPDVGKPILAPESRSLDISWGDRLGFSRSIFFEQSWDPETYFPGKQKPLLGTSTRTPRLLSGHIFPENKSPC